MSLATIAYTAQLPAGTDALYKLFLTLRYLRKRKIVFIAIGAVTLCVAMVLVVLSVMGGWLDMVQNRARGLLGDIVIDNRSYSGLPLYEEFLAELARKSEPWMHQIEQATPVIYSFGLIRFPSTGHNDYVRVVGIRLDEIVRVNAFKESLFYEKFYPGTTTLAEQQKPVFGRDWTVEPRPRADGKGSFIPFELPEPYQSALERARKEHLARTGEPLDDPDSKDDGLNEFLREEKQPIIPGIWAMDPTAEQPGEERAKYIDNAVPGLIIGRDIIGKRDSDARYRRYYPKGASLIVTLVSTSITGKVDPVPISQPFRYVDDSRTGIHEIDSRHIYCDFDLLQKQLQMNAADRVDPDDPTKIIGRVPARCSQIQIKVVAGADPFLLCEPLEKLYRAVAEREAANLDSHERYLIESIDAQTWQQSQSHIIGPVQKEKMLVTILFGIISLVAVVLILCILYMIVLQKTRDIGILKAIGASSGGAAAIWVMYGMSVGILGGLLGATLGSLFVHFINDIQDFLVWAFQFRVWDPAVYSFDQIPHVVKTTDLIAVVAIAILASTIGSVAAAWRAGRMEPVESIRYE